MLLYWEDTVVSVINLTDSFSSCNIGLNYDQHLHSYSRKADSISIDILLKQRVL